MHPLWVRAGTTDEVCIREVFDLRAYEFAPVAMPRVIVDAGANVGCTSVFFANRYPDAKIFAVEPETSNFQLLEQNTSPYKNVIPIRAALWSANCDLAVSDPGKGKWGFRTRSAHQQTGAGETVRGLTIERLVEEHNIPQIDLLKLDIEGAEREVFEGGASWLERVETIVIELHDRFQPGCHSAFEAAIGSSFPHRVHRGENLWVSRQPFSLSSDSRDPRVDDCGHDAPHIPIIATMLCGNNESLIGESIESIIDYVDKFLLIDTGITDGSLTIAQSLCGEKLWVEPFAWCNDFARARNCALELAATLGSVWALTIDTDERVEFDHVADRESLQQVLASNPDIRAWLVSSRDGSYAKERFIRVPTQLEWRGRTHEALCGATAEQRAVLPGAKFWEEPKTAEQFRKKLERDLAVLQEETQSKPENARWWYYLGQTLEQLGESTQAIEAYRHCVELKTGWAEEAAWAAYCGGRCLVSLERFADAIDLCALGLARQPASPELAWQAGYSCYKLGRDRDAIAWEEMAVSIGEVDGSKAARHRISFRHLPAWYEGPYDVLRHAHKRLGDKERASECEEKYQTALKTRLSFASEGINSSNQTTTEELPIPAVGRSSLRSGEVKRVAVLGLYSSGSTATAGILYHLGAQMGKRFWGNYYEPQWLSAQLRRWWDEPRLRETIALSERVKLLKRWMRDLSLDEPEVVAAKHPLLTLCGPDLIQAWGKETKFIWTHRPLDKSIASLARRGWWPEHYVRLQEKLWEAANSFFTNQEHLRIEFADVLKSPDEQVDRLIDYLGIDVSEQRRQRAIASIMREGSASPLATESLERA